MAIACNGTVTGRQATLDVKIVKRLSANRGVKKYRAVIVDHSVDYYELLTFNT